MITSIHFVAKKAYGLSQCSFGPTSSVYLIDLLIEGLMLYVFYLYIDAGYGGIDDVHTGQSSINCRTR